MVHRIYFYDSHVGTARILEFSSLVEEDDSFLESLKDFKFCLRYILDTSDKYNYIVLIPEDVVEDRYTNIVVDCSEIVLSYVIAFAKAFFNIRGFIG